MQAYNKAYHTIGLMSGTSLDGLDICYVKFKLSLENTWTFQIAAAETVAYPDVWLQKLAFNESLSSLQTLELDKDLGQYFGKAVNTFLEKNNIEKSSIDFIASHGHTLFHQPDKGITLQIGNGQAIALQTGIKTVYDFRTADVYNGGQGAPLVPIGDALLFSQYDACLNLGGFCNISLQHNDQRIAFDIGFCNLVLNRLAQKLNLPFDENGNLASTGQLDNSLLQRLNNLAFYKAKAPKSLGAEWLSTEVMPLLNNVDPTTALRTCTEHIAVQISAVLKEFDIKNVLLTGGGTHNRFLIERLKSLTNTQLIAGSNELINYKEALIFALLGTLRIENKINTLSTVTGAKTNLCTGVIANP